MIPQNFKGGLDMIILCHSNIIMTMATVSCHKHVIDQSRALYDQYYAVMSPTF